MECHTKSDITGADFKLKWNGRPAADLFHLIHTTMPDNAPGTLTLDQYLDVTSYLLRLNGAPGGGTGFLATDTLALKKLRMDIVVPAPSIDSLLPKSDTTKLSLVSLRSFRSEAILTRPFRATHTNH